MAVLLSGSKFLPLQWRGLGSLVATRGIFGSLKDRPKVSQSKVLSGGEGPLFILDGKATPDRTLEVS